MKLTPPLLGACCSLALLSSRDASALSTPSSAASSSSSSSIYHAILRRSSSLLDPVTGDRPTSPIFPPPSSSSSSATAKKKSLVVILPQLGEFDSSEYVGYLASVLPYLEDAGIDLRCVGICEPGAGRLFCDFTGLPISRLLVDPGGVIHRELGLYAGPGFEVSESVSDDILKFLLGSLPGGVPAGDGGQIRPVATAWLNWVGPVSIGPVSYRQWFADERGYQRPVELATVRLKNMVEVLTKWDEYVTDPSSIALRGATYLFDEDGTELYSYRSRGVLTYSETMPRPLSFLLPYIGKSAARNPLGMRDDGGGTLVRGRGVLKPAGKAMWLVSSLFKLENKLQARLLGAEDADYAAARGEIELAISSNRIVVYTYRLSPFSGETLAVLDEVGADYANVEVGLEWFLLDKERSVLRAQLLEMTGQSSLPHVFVDGIHVGGLFTGSSDGKYPGLAGLKESGELLDLIKRAKGAKEDLVSSAVEIFQ